VCVSACISSILILFTFGSIITSVFQFHVDPMNEFVLQAGQGGTVAKFVTPLEYYVRKCVRDLFSRHVQDEKNKSYTETPILCRSLPS
jgi:hypothetical protein